MEMVGLFLLVALAIGVLAFVVEAVGRPKRKREGTGEFEKYGPNASDATISLVDKRDRLYGGGLRDIRNSRAGAAETAWTEAAKLGSDAATMALGMLAYRRDERGRARELWEAASANGNVPAALFLKLQDHPTTIRLNEFSNRPLSVAQFIDSVIDSERGEPAEMSEVIGVALEYGYTDYASRLAARADKIQRGRS